MIALFTLLLSCAEPPPIPPPPTTTTVAGACQLCLFQRNGERMDIARRMLWPKTTQDVQFGHCFACLHCPGDGGTSGCLGFSPADLDAPEYQVQPGRIYADTDQGWSRVDCVPLLTQHANHIWQYAIDYDDTHSYQVINRQGGRSCLGFCEDIAEAAGLAPRTWAGDLTIPGGMRFDGATVQLRRPIAIDALGFTRSLVAPSPSTEDMEAPPAAP